MKDCALFRPFVHIRWVSHALEFPPSKIILLPLLWRDEVHLGLQCGKTPLDTLYDRFPNRAFQRVLIFATQRRPAEPFPFWPYFSPMLRPVSDRFFELGSVFLPWCFVDLHLHWSSYFSLSVSPFFNIYPYGHYILLG